VERFVIGLWAPEEPGMLPAEGQPLLLRGVVEAGHEKSSRPFVDAEELVARLRELLAERVKARADLARCTNLSLLTSSETYQMEEKGQ
jgi:hypothetical protein